MCEICLKFTIKTTERRNDAKFRHISHIVLMFSSLTLNSRLDTLAQERKILTVNLNPFLPNVTLM